VSFAAKDKVISKKKSTDSKRSRKSKHAGSKPSISQTPEEHKSQNKVKSSESNQTTESQLKTHSKRKTEKSASSMASRTAAVKMEESSRRMLTGMTRSKSRAEVKTKVISGKRKAQLLQWVKKKGSFGKWRFLIFWPLQMYLVFILSLCKKALDAHSRGSNVLGDVEWVIHFSHRGECGDLLANLWSGFSFKKNYGRSFSVLGLLHDLRCVFTPPKLGHAREADWTVLFQTGVSINKWKSSIHCYIFHCQSGLEFQQWFLWA